MSNDFEQTLTLFTESVKDYQKRTPLLAAYAALKADKPETADLLSIRACELFERVCQAHPDDPHALHHLAIIHHGSGYQLHLAGDRGAKEALEHWRRGIRAWAKLIRNDAFWAALRERWAELLKKSKHDMLVERLLNVDLQSFRDWIPRHLLSVHAGLVEEASQTDPRLAAEHVKIIVQSGFDAEQIERARKRIYRTLVGNVETLCREMKFEEARSGLTRYIQIDPDNARARCDFLRACSAECDLLGKSGENIDQRERVLHGTEAHARHPGVIQLVETDVLVAPVLRDYCCCQADLLRDKAQKLPGENTPAEARLYDQAHTWAREAVKHERMGQKARDLFISICVNGAMSELNCPASDLRIARKLLDSGLAVDPREPLLNAVKALYYLRARDDDAFREQFRHAEQLNRVANDALIRLYLYRGLSHTMTGNPTEGRSCYRRAKAKVRADTRPEIRTEVNQLGSVLE